MATAASLIVKIQGDTAGVRQALQQTEQRVNALGQAIDRAAPASLALLGAVSALGAGFLAAGAKGIQLAAQMEQSRIAFTTMLGDAHSADRFLRDLFAFAARTPFEIEGLQQASRQLLAFGFQAEQIIPTMTAIGDAIAALGGGEFEIERLTRALGQMQAKGKVAAQEMMQIAELGIPAWEMLAQKLGVSIPEAMKRVEQGGVSAATGIEAILEGLNARFAGSMEQQSQTLLGKWSTLKDNLTALLRGLGEEAVRAFDLKAQIDVLIESVGRLSQAIEEGGLRGVLRELVATDAGKVVLALASTITVGLFPAIGKLTLAVWALRASFIALTPWLIGGLALAPMLYDLANGYKAVTDGTDAATRTFREQATVARQLGVEYDVANRKVREARIAQLELTEASLQTTAALRQTEQAQVAVARASAMLQRTREKAAAVFTPPAAPPGPPPNVIDLLDFKLGRINAQLELLEARQTRVGETSAIASERMTLLETKASLLDQQIVRLNTEYAETVAKQGLLGESSVQLLERIEALRLEKERLLGVMQKVVSMSDKLNEAIGKTGGVVMGFPGFRTKEQLREQFPLATPEAIEEIFKRQFQGLDIPGLAHGGIVTRPTLALVGERGPEAVVPLNRRDALRSVEIGSVQITVYEATDPQKVARLVQRTVTDTVRRLVLEGA